MRVEASNFLPNEKHATTFDSRLWRPPIIRNFENMRPMLPKPLIIEALVALDAECAARGITGELCIYGGAGMVFDVRESVMGDRS